ncbi:endolytic transglycosylase MltG [uncultured Helicobacter sp.]|uniref:endolytic transglycosylase MltG n=1 Tax=uncultured Helicobacter sp. TaxID=175537 RepID=UPI00374F36B7
MFLALCCGVILYLTTPIVMPQVINVPKGSIKSIITYLNTIENVPPEQFGRFDALVMRFVGTPQSGFVDLGVENPTRLEFFKRLSTAKAATREVTLIPGETLYFFLQDVARMYGLDAQKLQESYDAYFHLPEGVIVPETYKLPMGLSEDALMRLLAQISYKWHEESAIKLMGVYDRDKWFYYVAIASIVQKEAANIEEMPIVAAVVFNRLKLGMPLQMDGSLNYGIYSHQKITPERIRNDTNPCNTYKYKGIPPYPCTSASLQAIKAVLEPADVEYLYFVRNKNGTHTFSKTYQEHRDNF